MVTRKYVDLFEIKNVVVQQFFRISYILALKWNFLFSQKRFLWIKLESLVKNGWLKNSSFLVGP